MINHKCFASGCERTIKRPLLMCRQHWFMVPGPTRKLVWALYRRDKAAGGGPTAEYVQAIKLARLLVKRAEENR